ncbi:ketopantoate reductase family protein [Subtercola lobariae]|uniref:2-dehydropantoate 2-reductase n=1 Tax=Subtercola lobariae TaxID=1588641 RepID=A0A917B693_9MICO|nr:2-dehydropantoate 2-reductase [Subtercola lobariae]GGF25259.1 2-dehydropantoate 2-reductase [Subtercola lobariae]
MQIGIVGAGAIGGSIAAALHRAGHTVELTARGENLDAIRRSGIHLTGAWGDHVADVTAHEALTVRPQLAFVTTKAQDARSAILANADVLRGLPIVVVQNGLESLDTARSALPEATWIGALALYAASYLSPGAVTITASGQTFLGADHGASDSTLTAALTLATATLAEAIPARAITNFRGAQWTKLIINQVNAMPAITGLSVQETISSPVLLPIVTASMREAVRTGFALGTRYVSLQGLSNTLLRAFSVAPITLGQGLPRLMARRMGDTPNPGSTLQSIRRGQLTEIDYLNGAVVAQAAAASRSAPINRTLVELVHEVERAGTFATPEHVATAVRR